MIPPLDDRRFPAKLLLFGEHVLLLGATALAVPVTTFGSHWDWGQQVDRHHARLVQFAESEALRSLPSLDAAQFKRDLEAGLFFRSDIPTGYGLGSSGALCAAIYERYAREKSEDLVALKSVFARMESFFHGNSSGIDPLTSYVGAPMLIQNKTEVHRAAPGDWGTAKPAVFLLDSRLPRRTGPLVEWFLGQSRNPPFAEKLSKEYLPAHEAALQAWLSADPVLFWPNLHRVSVFQLENFPLMVPNTMAIFWKQNIGNHDFILKICGAGGGGFVLGFARDKQSGQDLAKAFAAILPFG